MAAAALLTFVAMVAFAANSLLARAALAGHLIDAASFTAIRFGSGALALIVLLGLQQGGRAVRARPGNWISAICLLAYGLAFSLAYLRLGAATGALILFGSVQATMILWGALRRHGSTRAEAMGLGIAFAALVYLLLPGLQAPDLSGTALMVAAGIAWGAYTLRGRGAGDPLGETAGNFVRAGLICTLVIVVPNLQATWPGAALALISGVVTSGMGYALWYRVLPALSTLQAAAVQLTVPIFASIGGVLVLSEALTARLAIAGLFLLGGVGLAVLWPKPARGG